MTSAGGRDRGLAGEGATLLPVRTGRVFVRQLAVAGGGRALSVGKIVPADWACVRIQIVEDLAGEMVLRITKLA